MTAPALPVVGERYKRSAGVVWVVELVDERSVTFRSGDRVNVVSLAQWVRSIRLGQLQAEQAKKVDA